MRDILMATDLSPASGRALTRAVGPAAGSGARLTVLHVVDDRPPENLAGTVERGAQAAIRSQLPALPAAAGLAVEIRMSEGKIPFAAILETQRGHTPLPSVAPIRWLEAALRSPAQHGRPALSGPSKRSTESASRPASAGRLGMLVTEKASPS